MVGTTADPSGSLRTVGSLSEMEEDKPVVIDVDGTLIGVVKFGGRLHAFRNSCPHQGGPVAEGEVVGNVECVVLRGGERRTAESEERFNIACPWHGIEYDLETGVCRSDPRMRLRSYEVVVENGLVKVRV